MPCTEFFTQEFSNLDLKDSRLVRRAVSIGNTLLSSPGSCIQEVFTSKKEARCAYDFFSNPKVKWLNLLSNHQAQTKQRIQDSTSQIIYLIQDSTFYTYSNHKAKIDIGNIGKQGRFTQFGFLQHTSFCVAGNDIPLGVLELDFIGYDDELSSFSYREGFETFASSRWRRFLAQTEAKLKGIGKEVIMLCDREADFFEFLTDLHGSSCKFVIRSKYDRPTGLSGRNHRTKFSELFSRAPYLGDIELVIMDPHTHKEEPQLFHIKALTNITLPATRRGARHPQNKLPPIKLNVVEASNGRDHWVLLTNLPAHTFQEAAFVVESYRKRWHIESFHKVLKTAYKAENVYLHSSREAVQSLLTLINIAAYQTYWLIHQSRQAEEMPATQHFSLHEIAALHVYLYSRLPSPHTQLSLKEAYYQVAQLGGLKNLNNKHPPGILTIYRGIKKLNDLCKMYEAILSIKT